MGRLSDARKKAQQKKGKRSKKEEKKETTKAQQKVEETETAEKPLPSEDVAPPIALDDQKGPARKGTSKGADIRPSSGLSKDVLDKKTTARSGPELKDSGEKKTVTPEKEESPEVTGKSLTPPPSGLADDILDRKEFTPDKQEQGKEERSVIQEAVVPMKSSVTQKGAVLPPSGLAEDILEESEISLTTQVHTGPDQIYSFADDLAMRTTEKDDPGKRKHRFETWVTFNLSGESYGLPVSHVQEILRAGTITRVPHSPRSVMGITNNRGKLLPVVNLRVRMGLDQVDIDDRSRILVAESRGHLIGLLVDLVQQVVRLDRSDIQPAPPDVMTDRSDYILGVYHLEEALAIMLDVDRILVIKEFEQNTTAEDRVQ